MWGVSRETLHSWMVLYESRLRYLSLLEVQRCICLFLQSAFLLMCAAKTSQRQMLVYFTFYTQKYITNCVGYGLLSSFYDDVETITLNMHSVN